jgi:hypothetical protein
LAAWLVSPSVLFALQAISYPLLQSSSSSYLVTFQLALSFTLASSFEPGIE